MGEGIEGLPPRAAELLAGMEDGPERDALAETLMLWAVEVPASFRIVAVPGFRVAVEWGVPDGCGRLWRGRAGVRTSGKLVHDLGHEPEGWPKPDLFDGWLFGSGEGSVLGGELADMAREAVLALCLDSGEAAADEADDLVQAKVDAFVRILEGALDREALDVCHEVLDVSGQMYRFLCGDGDPVRRARRLQACRAMPFFARFFAYDGDDRLAGSGRTGSEFAAAIDAGRPLLPLLRRHGIPRGHARRMATASSGSRFVVRLSRIPEMCRLHTPERLPSTPAEWEIAAAFGPGAATGGVRWSDLAARIGTSEPFDVQCDLRDFRRSDFGIERWLKDLAATLFEAEWAASESSDPSGLLAVTVDGMLGGGGLMAELKASERWHAEQPAFAAAWDAADPGAENDVNRWPALFGEVAVGGFLFRCLTDRAGLAEEGMAMGHCVGGYANACLSGRSHVVSVMKDGKRVSTAEIAADTKGVRTVQHRGPGNDNSPADAERALATLLDAINDGEVPIDRDAVGVREVDDRPRRPSVGQLLAVVPVWRRILPKAAGPWLDLVEGCLKGELPKEGLLVDDGRGMRWRT